MRIGLSLTAGTFCSLGWNSQLPVESYVYRQPQQAHILWLLPWRPMPRKDKALQHTMDIESENYNKQEIRAEYSHCCCPSQFGESDLKRKMPEYKERKLAVSRCLWTAQLLDGWRVTQPENWALCSLEWSWSQARLQNTTPTCWPKTKQKHSCVCVWVLEGVCLHAWLGFRKTKFF